MPLVLATASVTVSKHSGAMVLEASGRLAQRQRAEIVGIRGTVAHGSGQDVLHQGIGCGGADKLLRGRQGHGVGGLVEFAADQVEPPEIERETHEPEDHRHQDDQHLQGHGTGGGADPLVRAGPPGPAALPRGQSPAARQEPAGGPAADQGVRPTTMVSVAHGVLRTPAGKSCRSSCLCPWPAAPRAGTPTACPAAWPSLRGSADARNAP